MTPPRDPDSIAQRDESVDRAREERQSRSAWSMVAAVALHAAALASWPTTLPTTPDLQATLDPSAVESAQPEWLFMDQALANAPQDGDGGATKQRPTANNSGVLHGIQTVDPNPVPEGISPDLRDRLVRSTSFAPTIAEDGGKGRGDHAGEDAGAALRGAGLTGLTATEHESLDELSALDLERLAAVRPEVALEASSAWVLVRNPGQVKDFILQHASDGRERVNRGAASVAIYISAAGSVEWAEVITSSGRTDWDDLALKLFNDVVTFRPARLQGVPTPMSAIFTVDFPW